MVLTLRIKFGSESISSLVSIANLRPGARPRRRRRTQTQHARPIMMRFSFRSATGVSLVDAKFNKRDSAGQQRAASVIMKGIWDVIKINYVAQRRRLIEHFGNRIYERGGALARSSAASQKPEHTRPKYTIKHTTCVCGAPKGDEKNHAAGDESRMAKQPDIYWKKRGHQFTRGSLLNINMLADLINAAMPTLRLFLSIYSTPTCGGWWGEDVAFCDFGWYMLYYRGKLYKSAFSVDILTNLKIDWHKDKILFIIIWAIEFWLTCELVIVSLMLNES